MDEQAFALRGGGQVVLGASELLVIGHTAPRNEPYRAIHAARAGEYGLATRIYYVTCHTDTLPIDLEFPDLTTRDRFVEALRALLA